MKKLLIAIGFVMAASAARASTYIPVLMSTATNPAVQAGTSAYSFHVASGTADNLTSSTFTATKATVTNFTATSATMTTVNLTNVNGTVVDSSTGTHSGSQTFSGNMLAKSGIAVSTGPNSPNSFVVANTSVTVGTTNVPAYMACPTTGGTVSPGYYLYVSTTIRSRTGSSLSSGVTTSIATTTVIAAGNYLVSYAIGYQGTGTITHYTASFSATSNTAPGSGAYAIPNASGEFEMVSDASNALGTDDNMIASPMFHISIASPTTFYLVAEANFASGTATAYGSICIVQTP